MFDKVKLKDDLLQFRFKDYNNMVLNFDWLNTALAVFAAIFFIEAAIGELFISFLL